MIKAAILDMDGLLIESEPLWQRAETECFAQVGLVLTVEMCRQTMGMRASEMVKHWYERHPWSGPAQAEVMHRILARLHEMVQGAALMEGVAETIDQLRSADIRMIIASSSPQTIIDAVIDNFGLRDAIPEGMSAEGEEHGKPHPAIFLRAAERLGVAPAECLVFEDSITGVIAAKAARMTTIAVPSPDQYGRPEFSIADRTLRSLKEFNLSDFVAYEPVAHHV